MGAPTRRARSAGRRALVAGTGLAGLWAVAFAVSDLAFFPLIAVGGIVTGLAGLWVRRAAVDRDGLATRTGVPTALPTIVLRPRHAALALGAAAAHLAIAYALVEVGARLAPQWTPTAEQVYGPAGEVTLWWALLLGGVVTAPLEEVYWRGAVHPLLVAHARRRLPHLARLPGATPTVGACVYAGFHLVTGHPALVAAALLGGWVWCWLAERTGSVGAPMLAHALWASSMLLVPPV